MPTLFDLFTGHWSAEKDAKITELEKGACGRR